MLHICNKILFFSSAAILMIPGCGNQSSPVDSQKPVTPQVSVAEPKNLTNPANLTAANEEQVKPYQSAAKPCFDEKNASESEMRTLLRDAEDRFKEKPLSELMSTSNNGSGLASMAIRPDSPIMMIFRTLPATSTNEVPIIAVGFGLGVNAIVAHGLVWVENGEWKSQPYPQAESQVAKKRQEMWEKGVHCSGGIVEMHQQGNVLAVVNDLFLGGTHNAQEVQLLQRENGAWKVTWAPTYDHWQVLWDSRIEFRDGIQSFIVHRTDIKDYNHKWDEVWKLQGTKYVMVSSSE